MVYIVQHKLSHLFTDLSDVAVASVCDNGGNDDLLLQLLACLLTFYYFFLYLYSFIRPSLFPVFYLNFVFRLIFDYMG